MPLTIETDLPEWQTWARQFPPKGNATPFVWIVRADGEVLFHESTSLSGSELPKLLTTMRSKAGAALTPQQSEALAKTVAAARKAHDEGDLATAVSMVGKFAQVESYAEPAVQATALAQTLIDEAEARLAKADEQLSGSEDDLDGALALVETQRIFKNVPKLARASRELRSKHLREKRDLITQAEMIDRGKAFEERELLDKAMFSYGLLLKRHPGTAAAQYAQAQIKRLAATGVAPPEVADAGTDAPAGGSVAAASSEDVRKAASYLRLVRVFAARQPERAREYAQRIIDLAPGTSQAAEAQTLLNGLN